LPLPQHEKVITLSTNNLSEYGFVCFYDKEDLHDANDFLIREIELASEAGKEKKLHKFKIPESLLIEISKDNKIVNSENYTINTIKSDLEPIKLLSERAGWNQTMEDLEAMNGLKNSGYQLATFHKENRDIPLGSGLSLAVSEDMSWIGMILVHPELRRQGIARSIMHSCLEHARLTQDKSIVGLDATPQGKQVYDSLGFKDSYKIWRANISTQVEHQSVQGLDLEPFSLELIKDYLNRQNNAERFQIVELLSNLQNSKNIMAVSDGVVSGFIMSRPGRLKPFIGPLIANSDHIAFSLLNRVLGHWNTIGFEVAFIDIPEYHIDRNSLFVNEDNTSLSVTKSHFSIKPLRSFVRMYQLVSNAEEDGILQNFADGAWIKAKESYNKTLAYMDKEKNEILPTMYAIGGPEMS
jgi:GNAT superfamily N-acetyltransferase